MQMGEQIVLSYREAELGKYRDFEKPNSEDNCFCGFQIHIPAWDLSVFTFLPVCLHSKNEPWTTQVALK